MAQSAIAKINFHFKPSPGEKLVGHTPKGDPIYERVIDKGKSVAVLDDEGKEVWELHPTTAQPVYPRRRVVSDPKVERFVPVDGGQGQVYREPWTPESEAEVAERLRKEKVARTMEQIAEAFVDRGLDPTDLAAALAESEGEEETEAPKRRGRKPRAESPAAE